MGKLAVGSARGLLPGFVCIYYHQENTNDGGQFYILAACAFDAHNFTLCL